MTHKHSIEIKIKDPKFSTDSKFSLRIFCSECSFKAVNSQILKNHMKREHPHIEIKTVLCDICLKTVLKHNLEFHKSEHHPLTNITKETFSCDFCNEERSSKRNLDKHIKNKHPELEEEKVTCDICLTYIYKSELECHKKKKHYTKLFDCKYCGGKFKQLDPHIVCKHPEFAKKTIQCQICLKFYRENYLGVHYSKMHEEKNVFCNNCGLLFSTVWYLQEHTKCCSPKNCRICGVLFKSWDEENVHMLKYHP